MLLVQTKEILEDFPKSLTPEQSFEGLQKEVGRLKERWGSRSRRWEGIAGEETVEGPVQRRGGKNLLHFGNFKEFYEARS